MSEKKNKEDSEDLAYGEDVQDSESGVQERPMSGSSDQPQLAPALMGLKKYVHIIFFVGFAILGWLLLRILDSIWTAIPSLPYNELASHVVAVAIAAGIAVYCWRHQELNRLVYEIVGELSKVTWPTRNETYASTVVVIITSCIAAMILGIFDFFWAWVTDFIYISG